jgi:hypothetical protein
MTNNKPTRDINYLTVHVIRIRLNGKNDLPASRELYQLIKNSGRQYRDPRFTTGWDEQTGKEIQWLNVEFLDINDAMAFKLKCDRYQEYRPATFPWESPFG